MMVCRTALRWLLQLTLHLHNNTNGELGSSLITLWGISKITTDRCLLFPDTDCFCKTIGCRSSNIPSGQSKAQGWLCCKPGQRLRHHIWPLSPSSMWKWLPARCLLTPHHCSHATNHNKNIYIYQKYILSLCLMITIRAITALIL